MEVLRFTLKKQTLPVVLETEAGEVTVHLVEMIGAERDSYLGEMGKKMNYGPDGKPSGLSSFEGLHAMLLTRCLVKETGEKYTVEEIQAFPSTTQTGLFEAAQELNALGEDGEEEAKKD